MANSAPATELDRSLVRLHVRDDACHVSYADTVVVTGKDGFIEGRPDEGLFVHQTRLLSSIACVWAATRRCRWRCPAASIASPMAAPPSTCSNCAAN